MTLEWHTAAEWRQQGYFIRKAAKSAKRNESGVPMFHYYQTFMPKPERRKELEKRSES